MEYLSIRQQKNGESLKDVLKDYVRKEEFQEQRR